MEKGVRRARLEESRKKVKIKLLTVFICFVLIIISIQFTKVDEGKIVEETSSKVEETTENKEEVKEENVEEKQKIIEPSESEEIKQLIEQIKIDNSLTEDNFSFFYYNPKTKKYYLDNGDKWYTAASTIKVPIAMIYYDKINNKEITLDSVYPYSSSDYEEGDGMTAYTYSPGDEIPLSFLIEQMIEKSDNTATNVLTRALGGRKQYLGDTLKYIDEKINIEIPENFYTENITSPKYGIGIMNYLYNHPEEYAGLIDHMKKSSYGSYLKKLIDCDVAHKYGSYEGHIHDYGIVYSNTPYLIGVFTKSVPNAEDLIANISKQVLDKHLSLEE